MFIILYGSGKLFEGSLGVDLVFNVSITEKIIQVF